MSATWLPADKVRAWMQLDGAAGSVLPGPVESARLAAAAYVRRVRPDLFTVDGGGPGDDAILAGLIATKRLNERSNGSGFAEFGATVAFLELDPDVSALLGLGPHAAPRVG